MDAQEPFTIVAAVNDPMVLRHNLLASPDLRQGNPHQFLAQEGYRSASLAYLDAIGCAEHDLLLFVHQDVYLPRGWLAHAARWIAQLERQGVPWGVAGAFGSRAGAAGGRGTVYTTGLGLHGNPVLAPEAVETLDEIVLITRRSSAVRFDPQLPHFHLYGADLCLQARSQGLQSFVLPGFCVHNTNQLLRLPAEFYECYRYTRAKWARYLPIYTSCMTMTSFDFELRRKRLRERLAPLIDRRRMPRRRADDPVRLLEAGVGPESAAALLAGAST